MAFVPSEAWVNEDSTVVAVRRSGGGYMYFVNAHALWMNKERLEDNHVIAREISGMNLELMEAKRATPTI